VRGAGSNCGLDSSTRTRRPPRATLAAVNNPAAEPPTTITSRSTRLLGRGCLSMFPKASVCLNGVRPLQIRSTRDATRKILATSRPTREDLPKKWVRGCPVSIANPTARANSCAASSVVHERSARLIGLGGRRRFAGLAFVRRALKEHDPAEYDRQSYGANQKRSRR
jgi:hypothetical protein